MHRTIILAAIACLFAVGTASAEESCTGSGKTLDKSAIEKRLNEQGYSKIRGIQRHNGCYEAKGFDKSGRRFELEVNSWTGKIVTKE